MLLVMDMIIFAVLALIVVIPYKLFKNIFKLW